MTPEEIEEWESRQEQATAPFVPQTITNGQGREALHIAGLYSMVDAIIDAIPDEDMRERARIAWNHRPTFERASPFVLMMQEPLGLSDEQLDQLFIDASKL